MLQILNRSGQLVGISHHSKNSILKVSVQTKLAKTLYGDEEISRHQPQLYLKSGSLEKYKLGIPKEHSAHCLPKWHIINPDIT